ncbi:hypothetical protein GLOIN_2v1780831 [Rhizophagus clarus]|uniref:Uncharacterized protein n=1 Tax=Rhizophagus clarus TaxID=94130 RepID=A0A8H3LCE2_9GLOM|nr:hypothetical protein GLOIN_2v1780831 [Rhizophagus clarus]
MPSNAEYLSNQENVENKIQIEENSTYPLDNNIIYRKRMNKTTKHSFNYIIIKEGVYPNAIVLNKKNILETSNEISQFRIKYSSNFQHVVFSTKSATDAAIKYERLLKPGTKVKISGPILFELQLHQKIL